MRQKIILILNSRKNLVLSLLIVWTFASISCQKQISFENSKEIPKDWQKIETEYFSFSIPPTMQRNNLQGIDSQMMGFENDEISLEIDYGMYSTKLESLSFEQKKEPIIIDGEKTTLISFDENNIVSSTNQIIKRNDLERVGTTKKHFISGVNFPYEIEVIAPRFRFAASFIASCETLEAQETAKIILYSIKFKQK